MVVCKAACCVEVGPGLWIEGVVALWQVGMVGWMCGVVLGDRLPGGELGERLGVDDIALVLQQGRRR